MELRAARRLNDLMPLVLLFVALSCVFYTVFMQSANGEQQLKLHEMVLANKAPAAYQYQMYIHDWIIEGIFRAMPNSSSRWFSISYSIYYGLGLGTLLLTLFTVCSALAGRNASFSACLYLVAILPIFWYDSYYHPGDPWGAWLALLL